MMSHAGMFNGHERAPRVDDLQRDRLKAWEEWKALEERRRSASAVPRLPRYSIWLISPGLRTRG